MNTKRNIYSPAVHKFICNYSPLRVHVVSSDSPKTELCSERTCWSCRINCSFWHFCDVVHKSRKPVMIQVWLSKHYRCFSLSALQCDSLQPRVVVLSSPPLTPVGLFLGSLLETDTCFFHNKTKAQLTMKLASVHARWTCTVPNLSPPDQKTLPTELQEASILRDSPCSLTPSQDKPHIYSGTQPSH